MTPKEAPVLEGGYKRKTLLWITGVAAASFVLFLVLLARGGDATRPETSEPNSYSVSALGHKALIEFLKDGGMSVIIRRNSTRIPIPRKAVVIAAEPQSEELGEDERDYFERLKAQTILTASPLVVVLPKWTGQSRHTLDGRWVESVSLLSRDRVQSVLDNAIGAPGTHLRVHRSAGTDPRWVHLPLKSDMGKDWKAKIRVPQLIGKHPDLTPLVWTEEGILIARYRSWKTDVYLVSDPDILNNAGLHQADHAVLVHHLLKERLHAEKVVVDEVIHGYVKNMGFLAEFLQFPMILVTLHGMLVLVLACWAGMGRIRKPRNAPSRLASGKEPMLENTARLLLFAGHGRDSLRRYLNQTLKYIGQQYSLPRDLKPPDLANRLQAISSARGLRMDLGATRKKITALPAGREARDGLTLGVARSIYNWRQEMTHT